MRYGIKIILGFWVLTLAHPASAAAKGKFNLLGGFSIATGGGKVYLDLGAEMRVANKLYLQVILDTTIGGSNRVPYFYPYYGRGYGLAMGSYPGNLNLGMTVGTWLYGVNVSLVNKYRISEKVFLSIKAGLFLINQTADDNDYSFVGYRTVTDTFFGYATGLGTEYSITKRLAAMVGGNYKWLFDKPDPDYPGNDNLSGLMVFMGLIFRL